MPLVKITCATKLLCPWDFPGKNTEVDCHSLLQRIFETQTSNPGLLHAGRFFTFTMWTTREAPLKRLLLFSLSVVSKSLRPHGLQHARLPCPSPSPGVCSNLCPLSQWCHLTISSSVIPISSCLQSFPGSGSFSASGSASGIEPALLHCRPTLLPSEPPGNWD